MTAMGTAQVDHHRLQINAPFVCESGEILPELEIAYTTAGRLNAAADNVAWVLHPLTCNADPTLWWSDFVGKDCVLNPDKYFIICVNSLGSCYGTTGPLSTDPRTGRPYGRSFPRITVRDVVAMLEQVRTQLGIDKIRIGAGGSYGGQQLLEWMATCPQLFEFACVIGADLRQTPWAVALNETQRMAMECDPTFFSDGPEAGEKGLAAARALAVLSYRSPGVYLRTQAEQDEQVTDGFRASSYQRHIGRRFSERFNAHAYWILTKAMDSHNPARGRGDLQTAFQPVSTRVLFVGLGDDILFPARSVAKSVQYFQHAQTITIDSDHGHDSILTHASQIADALSRFTQQHHSSDGCASLASVSHPLALNARDHAL